MYDLGNRSKMSGFCYNGCMKFEDVEKKREAYKEVLVKRLSITYGIIFGVFLLFLVINIVNSSSMFSLFLAFWLLLFFGIFALVIILITVKNERTAYHQAYKGYFVHQSLSKAFSKLVYNREQGISKEYLRATGMINTGDRYSTNDYVHGEYKDVAFTQADVHIEVEHTDSDGDTTYVTIFRGRFMDFEFPKKFSFRVEVAEKGFGANRVPGGKNQNGRSFEKIELESSEFNKMFRTYAEDGFEAFYILDPAMMNNILTLGEKHKGKILLCFIDSHLLVGLNDGKDAFEPPSVFKPIDEQAEVKKVTEEINLITGFVDELKLNRKIFK